MFDIHDKKTFKELKGRNIRISVPSSRVGVPTTDILLDQGIVQEADWMYITMEHGSSIASDYPNMKIEFLDEFKQIQFSPIGKETQELIDFTNTLHRIETGRFKCEQENSSASFRGGDELLPDDSVVGGEK